MNIISTVEIDSNEREKLADQTVRVPSCWVTAGQALTDLLPGKDTDTVSTGGAREARKRHGAPTGRGGSCPRGTRGDSQSGVNRRRRDTQEEQDLHKHSLGFCWQQLASIAFSFGSLQRVCVGGKRAASSDPASQRVWEMTSGGAER